MRLPDQDAPSPILYERQILDFGHRVLYSTAKRLGGNSDWVEVTAHFQTSNDQGTERLSFEGNWDTYSGSLFYTVSIEHINEIDSLEDDGPAPNYRKYAQVKPLEYTVTIYDESDEDSLYIPEVTLSSPAFYGTETTYFFNIPYSDDTAYAHKSTYANIYDEDLEPLDTEVAYYWQIHSNTTSAEEIKNLVQFSELTLDATIAEKMLLTVTIYDLELVMNSLKKFGLVNPRQKPLKGRLR